MTRYYRLQPAGLGLDHDSESSEGMRSGLDVFRRPSETLHLDGMASAYGDEVVVIEGDASWSNGDVEGVRINGNTARIVARYPWSTWIDMLRVAANYEADNEMTTRDWYLELQGARCEDEIDAAVAELLCG